MSGRDEEIAERAADNLEAFMEDGPRLSTRIRSWVLAKDPEAGFVLNGGLGAMGVGRMWFPVSDYDREDETYAQAPIHEVPWEDAARWGYNTVVVERWMAVQREVFEEHAATVVGRAATHEVGYLGPDGQQRVRVFQASHEGSQTLDLLLDDWNAVRSEYVR